GRGPGAENLPLDGGRGRNRRGLVLGRSGGTDRRAVAPPGAAAAPLCLPAHSEPGHFGGQLGDGFSHRRRGPRTPGLRCPGADSGTWGRTYPAPGLLFHRLPPDGVAAWGSAGVYFHSPALPSVQPLLQGRETG